MSYNDDLGIYHTKRIKRYVNALPEFYKDYREVSTAESILHYVSPAGKTFYCEPAGILSAHRGIHPDFMILDDILRDPQVKLDLSQLQKIERTFFEVIEQRPKEELHLIGTPQDQSDLLSELESTDGYNCKRYDAITNEENKQTWWKEHPDFNWGGLESRRKRIGDKAFMKEFRCMPVRGMEGYISLLKLQKLINQNLINYGFNHDIELANKEVVAGFDIGKKTHPSHLGVYLAENRKLKQIHSKFMDNWEYKNQIEYCKQAIQAFKIDALLYDDTRAEFALAQEQGELPPQMEGITFTSKSKFSMATELDKLITNEALELLPDDRQKRQILSVDCDLKAPETDEGHGDAFFSLALAVLAYKRSLGDVAWCV